MNIINPGLQFRTDKLAFGNNPDTIVLHHAEASHCTVQNVHQWHLDNGWAGIGYHFFVDKVGQVFSGRPENAVGAHCPGMNDHSIGICAEGAYMSEQMPEAQKQAIIELGIYIRDKYHLNRVGGHKEFYSTDCPGNNYPLEEIKSRILGGTATSTPQQPAKVITDNLNTFGVITASVLNVRSAPSTSSSILGTLANGTKVRIGAKQNDWYNIYYGDHGGWIFAKYINIVDNAPAPSTKEVYKTVKALGGLNVRSGPSTNNDIIGVLSEGDRVRVGGEAPGWTNIYYGDHGGWVSSQYLQ